MDRISIDLIVFFEDPFWVGVFERVDNKKLSVCKYIFGAEPKDSEILDFVLNQYNKLVYSPEIQHEELINKKLNPKRVQRNIRKQVSDKGIGTKSQQALKRQQEQNKTMRKKRTKEQKELEKEQMFFKKQQKRKEKHKGR